VKKLFAGADAEIEAVYAAIRQARDAHYSMTVPFSSMGDKKGPRLLSNYMIIGIPEGNPEGLRPHKGYLHTMKEHAAAIHARMAVLENVYDQRVQEAKAALGQLWKEEDYPPFEDFKRTVGIHFAFTPVPVSDDWMRSNLGQLSATAGNWMADRMQKQCDLATKAAVKDAIERVIEPLERMVKATAPVEKGQKARKIFDTLVGNLQTAVDVLQHFNLYNDPAIEEIRKRIQEELVAYTTEEIRESESVKADLHEKSKEIFSMVQDLDFLKF
jgi:hypothetical protein